jgi:predicted amidohydrolase
MTGGDGFATIATDRGRIAILTGFDVEFPELARMAAHAEADICFTPFAADLRQSYLRLRTCAHANVISNGMYAVLCGAFGAMPQVSGSDLHYAQSCVLTPCDPAFTEDGVAAEAGPGIETLLVQDLDLAALHRYRMQGSVRPWQARRRDLYRLRWIQDQRARQI